MWGNNGIFVTMTSSGQSLEQSPLSTEKDTDCKESGIFSKVPYATQQPTEMQMWLHSDDKWRNSFEIRHVPHTYPVFPTVWWTFQGIFRVIKERWLGEWNTSWPWWETDKLMCEPSLPSVRASARRAFYHLCVCKWGEKQNLLNC